MIQFMVYPVETLEADHIVSMKEIAEMDGFASLSDVDKVEVLNFEDNFMGLGKPTNSSKGLKLGVIGRGIPN